ncbi:hypothetical protein Q1W70_19365 [Pseudomonas kielensis]|uniref:hypothetical protein n=1 Tax=Pseudomonas TaxID=286 RepID=UPI0014130AD8|nr:MULTISPECIES: hypothetical protein [Pseudomonas]NBB35928.1 hypothetical protein [Pseudomonas sp. BC115LW]UZM16168.1 hypothetical protein LZV00_10825 [Pseudomonas kielensis]WKL51618.1 hypothetical protein Q1W70_19365 [Pseudomonas kielensis]
MNWLTQLGWRHWVVALAVVAFLGWAIELQSEKEIALKFGEPWEDMRQRSSAAIGPTIPGHFAFSIPKSDARLRFIDPQYGFITPLARFFTINFNSDGLISGIRMSPQIEPLLLDDALNVVLDLQEQWRKGGWTPNRAGDFPSFADTPQWRAQLREVNKGGTAYWLAGDKYQVMLMVNRFRDYKRPTEERYLITLGLSKSRGVK